MIVASLVIVLAAATAGQVEVYQTTKLTPFTAALSGLSNQGLEVEVSNERRNIPLQEVRKLKFSGNLSVAALPMVVTLRDGSTFSASKLSGHGAALQVHLPSGRAIEIPTKFIQDVRLRELNETQQKQWQAQRQSRIAGDMLVLVRSAEALDTIDGLIVAISDEAVTFDFGGEEIPAPLDKLAAVRFFANAKSGEESSKLLAIVQDRNGGLWNASLLSFDLETSEMQLTLQGGLRVSLETKEIAEIDFSVGSMKYLADLESIDRSAKPRFQLGIPVPGAEKVFGARVVPGANGPGIEFLGGGSTMVRVPSDFVRLVGSVEMNPPGNQLTPCQVRILIEKQVVWEKLVDRAGEVHSIDLPIQGDQRLQLVVEPQSESPVGDIVLFKGLRFLK